MNDEQWAQYIATDYEPPLEDWQATFSWIDWKHGLCYPPPHEGKGKRDSLLTIIVCDVISFFWVLGKVCRRRK